MLDRGPDESVPALAVIAVARDGAVIQSAPVGDDGAFSLPKPAVEKAGLFRDGTLNEIAIYAA